MEWYVFIERLKCTVLSWERALLVLEAGESASEPPGACFFLMPRACNSGSTFESALNSG